VHGADFAVVRLPTGLATGVDGALPGADAVLSTGHVLNYLDTRADIAQALRELARAVRPAGVLVFRRVGDSWRRSDEHHRNLTFDVDNALNVLRENGIDAHCRAAFGEEKLPEG
jgi:SAM-dependent methyltransferase